jgi:hypothetical protein
MGFFGGGGLEGVALIAVEMRMLGSRRGRKGDEVVALGDGVHFAGEQIEVEDTRIETGGYLFLVLLILML